MKIIVAGDFCARGRVDQELRYHNYDGLLGQIKPIVEKVDYSFVNLECPIVEHDAQPILKCGPNLKGSREMVDALLWAGFNCFTLANNHILDYGEIGMQDTLMYLNEKHASYVGGGSSINQASEVLYKDIKGKILAVINCCEHEFSLATETSSGANPLNPIQQFYKIQEARQKADYVLVIVHGGHEHFQLPSPRMKETYRFFVDAGADAVINHHQHCYSGYEVYRGKPIFYGIGNFLFDWEGERNSIWNEGYMVEINFCSDITFSIYPYCQCNDEIKVKILPLDSFNKKLQELNSIIEDDDALRNSVENYYKDCHKTIETFLEPLCNKWIVRLRRFHLFPKLVNKNWIPRISNVVLCESHRDKLEDYFRTKLK